MKFFHLSDLHIGRQLHRYNLKEDQRVILREVVNYAKDLRPDAVVIAGDIYDKSVPSAEAVSVFDEFLTALSQITPQIPVLIISGNHDSAERLKYAADILKNHGIYVAGSVPENSEEQIDKVTLRDEYGEVDFYLLPFLKPAYVRNVWEESPETYNDAVKRLIEREEIDFKKRRNVLVSHQFYTGGGENPDTCDSEVINVGGIDNVDISAIKEFDYAALGHLHGAQKVGESHIRYCGTLLKYSVSECEHNKSLAMINLQRKGKEPEISRLPLHPLRDVKKKRGLLRDILENAAEEEREDYVSVTLTDETDPYKPKEQLEKVYSHVLEVRIDNTRVRRRLYASDEELSLKDPLAAFCEFYKEMQGKEPGEKEKEILEHVIDKIKDE